MTLPQATLPAWCASLYERATRDPTIEGELRTLLEEQRAARDPSGIAWACLCLARFTVTVLDDPDTAGALLDEGLAAVGDADPFAKVRLLQRRGTILLAQDQWVAALAPLIAASRMVGFPDDAMAAQQNLAFVLYNFRDFPAALARFQACLPSTRRMVRGPHNPAQHAHVLYGVVSSAAACGDLAAARSALHEFRQMGGYGKPQVELLLGLCEARLAESEGRWTDVLLHATAHDTYCLGPHLAAVALRFEGRARAELGDREAARQIASVLVTLPIGTEEGANALQWAADLALSDGDLVTADILQDRALTLLEPDARMARTIVEVSERSEDGLHSRDTELARTHDALNLAYSALEGLRQQLEVQVRERTRALEVEVQARREAEEVAVLTSLAKSRFLANISHELRTPLNVIIGYAEMLDEDLGSRQGHDAAAIGLSGRHLLAMIDQALDLTRIEAGSVELLVAPVDVDALLRDVAVEVGSLVRVGGNLLVCDWPPNLGLFRTDPLRLRQILLNLLGNAAKFTDLGTLTLGARRGTTLELWVTDTGIGIAPEHVARLFAPFEQVDPTPARRHGGTGLGLAISRHLAELLGGGITVDSTLGGGSTFTVHLREP